MYCGEISGIRLVAFFAELMCRCDGNGVSRHFWSRTLRTQNISAPSDWCRNVRTVRHQCRSLHFGTGTELSRPPANIFATIGRRGRSPFSHLSHPNPNPNSYPNPNSNPNLNSNPTLTLTFRRVTKVRKWTRAGHTEERFNITGYYYWG